MRVWEKISGNNNQQTGCLTYGCCTKPMDKVMWQFYFLETPQKYKNICCSNRKTKQKKKTFSYFLSQLNRAYRLFEKNPFYHILRINMINPYFSQLRNAHVH